MDVSLAVVVVEGTRVVGVGDEVASGRDDSASTVVLAAATTRVGVSGRELRADESLTTADRRCCKSTSVGKSASAAAVVVVAPAKRSGRGGMEPLVVVVGV